MLEGNVAGTSGLAPNGMPMQKQGATIVIMANGYVVTTQGMYSWKNEGHIATTLDEVQAILTNYFDNGTAKINKES